MSAALATDRAEPPARCLWTTFHNGGAMPRKFGDYGDAWVCELCGRAIARAELQYLRIVPPYCPPTTPYREDV